MANHVGGTRVPDGQAAFTTRMFHAGGLCFRVKCSSDALVRSIEHLFVDLNEPQEPHGTICDISLTRQGDGRLLIEGTTWSDPRPVWPDFALDLLVGMVNRLALDSEPDALHIHAGCASMGNRAVIIAAHSGAGKSTLTAALVARGWTYLSDETVRIDGRGMRLSGFPKPLTLKPGGQHLWPQLRAHRVTIDDSDRTSWQVPASAFGGTPTTDALPHLVVLLHRADPARDPARAEPVHPADATVQLLNHALDGRRFGAAAVERLADLARRSAPFRVDAGQPVPTAILVEELMERAAATPVVGMQVLATSGGFGRAVVPSDVSTVMIGDRVVIYRTSTGKAASFDVHGSRSWCRLLEIADDEHFRMMAVEPGIATFLLELEELGFVHWDDPIEKLTGTP